MSEVTRPFDYSRLSVPERIQLAQELWESVYDQAGAIPLTEDQRQEIGRRWAAYEAGESVATPWPVIKRRLLEE